jgi:hypothetical protein
LPDTFRSVLGSGSPDNLSGKGDNFHRWNKIVPLACPVLLFLGVGDKKGALRHEILKDSQERTPTEIRSDSKMSVVKFYSTFTSTPVEFCI